MDSDTDDIDAQIAALHAVKERKLAAARKAKEREARDAEKVLVGVTPTKEKTAPKRPPSPPRQPVFGAPSYSAKANGSGDARPRPAKQELPSLPAAGSSRMLSSLVALRRKGLSTDAGTQNTGSSQAGPSRPSGSAPRLGRGLPGPNASARASADANVTRIVHDAAPAVEEERDAQESNMREANRDEDTLQIIENLRPGPKEFGLDPDGESGWETVEPNSRIRLSKRILAHSTLQDHLFGRYYLPPSLLYSVIRLSRDGATYDVPVDGEWVTIAVVAERGDVRVSGTREAGSDSESDDEGGDPSKVSARTMRKVQADTTAPKVSDTGAGAPGSKPWKPWAKNKKEDKQPRRRPRKYINLRLAALPPRTEAKSTAGGASGDALLQLLLFEADSVSRSEPDEEGNVSRRYKGGSGGAYERWCNLNPGDVVGIVSPRVLRPLKSGTGSPHPLTLPLALNPYSADSVFVIGQSRDLGRCSATQKDGNRCRTWVDTRQGQVCEYHVHLAIQRSRAGRAEFTASTSSFALSSRNGQGQAGPFRGGRGGKAGVGIDHRNKTGLLPAGGPQTAPHGPDNGGGGVTYVVGGGVIRANGSEGLKGWGEEHISEKLGRSRADKRKRRMEEKEAEKALDKLLTSKDGLGARYLAVSGAKDVKRRKDESKSSKAAEPGDANEDEGGPSKSTPGTFSAETIRRIGFDPRTLYSQPRLNGEEERKRAQAIASLKTAGKTFDPSVKIKVANVRAPPGAVRLAMGAPIARAEESSVADLDEGDGVGDGGLIDLD